MQPGMRHDPSSWLGLGLGFRVRARVRVRVRVSVSIRVRVRVRVSAMVVFLVVLGSVVTGPRVGAPRKQRRAQTVVNRGGRVVVRARTIRAPMQGWGC